MSPSFLKRVLLVVGLLGALSASAYVLPGGSIMRRLVMAREELGLSTLKADGSLLFYGAAVKEAGSALGLPTDRPELDVDATVSLKVPGRCRLETKVTAGNPLAIVYNQGRKRVEGTEVPALSEAMRQVCNLIAIRGQEGGEGREALEAHLRSLGIEPRTTSLARFDGEVVFVLGTPGEGKPQFWVYKDGFRPARVRYTDKGGAWDVRFLDYTSPATGEAMPRTLEVWRDGQRLVRFTALQGDTRAKLDDKLF